MAYPSKLPSGGIEFIRNKEEKDQKAKLIALQAKLRGQKVRKGSDIGTSDLSELVYHIARELKII